MNQTLDPFNWPFPKRDDLMSLSSIRREKDLVRVKTSNAITKIRATSMNLTTTDISGKTVIWLTIYRSAAY
jgi:hypothetical protein